MRLQITNLDFNKPIAPQYKPKNTKGIPEVTSLQLINFVLYNRSVPHLQSAFSAIPVTVTGLNISHNHLGKNHTGKNIALAMSAIPLTVIELNLQLNQLNLLQATGIGLVLKAFSGRTLNLENNELGQITGKGLASAFSHISPNVTQLNLRDNHLDILKATDLQSTCSSIPVTVTHLDLSWNNLGSFPNTDLELIFASIPKGVKTLNFNGNNLVDRTEKQWMELLSRLPETVDELIMDDVISQAHLSRILQEVRERTAKITQQVTSLPPPLTNIMIEYASNFSSFWNPNNSVDQDALQIRTPEEEISSVINKVILR